MVTSIATGLILVTGYFWLPLLNVLGEFKPAQHKCFESLVTIDSSMPYHLQSTDQCSDGLQSQLPLSGLPLVSMSCLLCLLNEIEQTKWSSTE